MIYCVIGDNLGPYASSHDRLIELLAAVRFARWMVGIFVALISALVGLIGLALYRLPAIIEAFRGAAPGS